jgi:ribosomal protein S18 acetylase RimI-like enzyme
MTAPLVIRDASIEDVAALAAFAANAFYDTYRGHGDPKEIADYVAEHLSVSAVTALAHDPGSTIILGELGSQLAGYAVLKTEEPPSCVTGPNPIELVRLYLDQEFLGRGFGEKLLLEVHAQAKRLGANTLWLGVYDRNDRAVRFYERLGFTRVGGKEFLLSGSVYIDRIYSAPVHLATHTLQEAAAYRNDVPAQVATK